MGRLASRIGISTGRFTGGARGRWFHVWDGKRLVLVGTFPISELDWALQPVFFEESSLEVKALGGLHGMVRVRVGIPSQSGLMTDSDWLNYSYDGNTDKTNFSQSNSFTDSAVFVDARLGWEFSVGSSFSVEPFLSLGYMSCHWSARDGYVQYPPGWFSATPPSPPYPQYSTDPRYSLYGTSIVYEQTYLMAGAGVRAALRFGQKWEVTSIFTVSPAVSCNSFDTHVLREIDISDNMSGGWMIEPEVDLGFSFSPNVELSLDASYRHIWNLVGTETVSASGVNYPGTLSTPGSATVYPNYAGAAFDALSVSLNFSLLL